MTAANRGMLVGALTGCVAAVVNWEGDIIQAASSIIVGAAIGWATGYYIGKRRAR